jgi:hypothetical protein
MAYATARRLSNTKVLGLVASPARAAIEASMISQIANALYPVLITDESDPVDQARKREQVAEAARAAWMRFSALIR